MQDDWKDDQSPSMVQSPLETALNITTEATARDRGEPLLAQKADGGPPGGGDLVVLTVGFFMPAGACA